MTMGQRIKMWREQAGLPRGVIEALTRDRGLICAHTLKYIEDDLVYPTDAQIYKLSRVLEVPLSYFFADLAPDRPHPIGYSSRVPPGKTKEELMEMYGCLRDEVYW